MDSKELQDWIARLTLPVELRVIDTSKGTLSGYYDDAAKLVETIAALDAGQIAAGVETIYTTIDAINPDLLARSYNKLRKVKQGQSTADKDVIRRTWLKIDADVPRPKGISSTDAEHEAALLKVGTIADYLSRTGFPSGLQADSGNGGHLLYRIDLPNDDATRDVISTFLAALGRRFDHQPDTRITIDQTTFNAARVWKCYGTMVRKGDEFKDRKHRLARILKAPAAFDVVSVELIQAVIADNPPQPDTKPQINTGGDAELRADYARLNGLALSGNPIEFVSAFLERHKIEHAEPVSYRGGLKWKLMQCPFCETTDAVCVYAYPNAEPKRQRGFKCSHNRCAGKTWATFRQHFEPLGVDAVSLGVEPTATGGRYNSNGEAVPTSNGNANGKPVIHTGGQLADVVDTAIRALHDANSPPWLFDRAGAIVRLNGSQAEPLTEGTLLDILSRVAVWKSKRGNVIPSDVRKVLLAKRIGLPVLRSVVSTPTYTATGQLLTTAGYNAESKTYYAPADGLNVPPVSNNPTADDIAKARALLLDDVLGDFPFADDASRAHALALLLLPFVRRMIDGATPLHLVSAPTEGTGKGLLARCFALITTGSPLSAMHEANDDAEWGKQIVSALMTGSPYICLDNLSKPLKSGKLASALTEPIYTDRLLGVNRLVSCPVDCVWLATGNNPHGSKEITRRMVLIRLDASMEHPQLRSGFRHPDLVSWVRQHRSELVAACLTLCAAWIAKGKPLGKPLGSFENWAGAMAGILDTAGVSGLLGNLDTLYQDVNTSDAEWREFVSLWWDSFGTKPATASQLTSPMISEPLSWLSDCRNAAHALGKAIGARIGKVYGGLRIERAATQGGHDKVNTYRLWSVECKAPAALASEPPAESKADAPAALDSLAARRCRQVGSNWIAEPVYQNGKPTGGYRVADWHGGHDHGADVAWSGIVASKPELIAWCATRGKAAQ